MKKIFFILITVMLFAGCDKGGLNDAYYANWEGEYEATEIIETIAENSEKIETSPARTTTITIFRDKFLYVQSYGIGDPFMPGVDPENHTVRLMAPKHMPVDADPEGEEPEESGIENVVVDDQNAHIILRNGGVVSMFNGVMYAPKAIRVASATENELTLVPGQAFEVELTDVNGIDLGSVTCHWTYSPIRKEGDTYIWEAVLHLSQNLSTANDSFNTFRHILTMTKKVAQ